MFDYDPNASEESYIYYMPTRLDRRMAIGCSMFVIFILVSIVLMVSSIGMLP